MPCNRLAPELAHLANATESQSASADLLYQGIRPVLPQLSNAAVDANLIDYVAQRKRFESALLSRE